MILNRMIILILFVQLVSVHTNAQSNQEEMFRFLDRVMTSFLGALQKKEENEKLTQFDAEFMTAMIRVFLRRHNITLAEPKGYLRQG